LATGSVGALVFEIGMRIIQGELTAVREGIISPVIDCEEEMMSLGLS